MPTVWFALLSLLMTVYVVLDGFDFGAGILHLFVARNDQERRLVLSAIGPVWNGNEVWLVAAGGTLIFAFPRAYAAAFSGFYLPLMMVLWLLILRGAAIEFRSLEDNPLWRGFWDSVFALSSALLALVFGVALGNVLRGVPLDATGYFQAPLFTDFLLSSHPGALDWYSGLVGLFALLVLGAHGALYLRWKCAGPVAERSARAARFLWTAVLVVGGIVTAETASLRPTLYQHLLARPPSWLFALAILLGASAVAHGLWRKRERSAFLGGATFIAALLGATATGLYPTILPSTLEDRFSLTAPNSATAMHGLAIGLAWWIPALLLAVLYFGYLFRAFSGKVSDADSHD